MGIRQKTPVVLRVCLGVLLFLFIISCNGFGGATNYRFRVHGNNSRTACISTKTYGYQHRDFGEYRKYTAEVHSQVFLEENHLTADEVAELAILVREETLKMYPMKSWHREILYEVLQNTLVVVLDGEPNLAAFWPGHGSEGKLAGAMYVKRGLCFTLPENVYYVITVRDDRFYRYDPSTVVHEMMHLISYIVTSGDFDSEHKNPELWANLSRKSLQTGVLIRFHDKLLTRRSQKPIGGSAALVGVAEIGPSHDGPKSLINN